ncbi:hypothetical protein BJ138DRAFT_1162095 [Hygrophoropsis aurantiaca]|uniref:Uncharacterized protein n=1 Tax=Hygrophoropsis aurantiaca TaxID=72124 RepID=A0ACB8A044_9AGAM|nr:hypothetical protein BJ138DRAFT_1162095 [Hygrophoropsis aurantiaca]
MISRRILSSSRFDESAFLLREVPSLIALTVSLMMYGITLAQYLYYRHNFPFDKGCIKYFVLFLFTINTLHMYGSTADEWEFLVSCHHNSSPTCFKLSQWQSNMTLFLNFVVPSVVQSFYAYRIWIISGRNKMISGMIYTLAAIQMIIGCVVMVFLLFPTLVSPPMMILGGPIAGVMADLLISTSIYFYLRPNRFGLRRTETWITRLTSVSINMGCLTCALSIMALIIFVVPALEPFVIAIGMIVTRCQVHSVLAVLNARKPLCNDRNPDPYSTIQLPELPTIQLAEISAPTINEPACRSQNETARATALI